MVSMDYGGVNGDWFQLGISVNPEPSLKGHYPHQSSSSIRFPACSFAPLPMPLPIYCHSWFPCCGSPKEAISVHK